MKKPEIIGVTLTNQDVALFVNKKVLMSLDSTEAGQNPLDFGSELAKALGVEMHTIVMDAPLDTEWAWAYVYELIPQLTPNNNDSTSVTPVKYWDHYHSASEEFSHQLEIDDKSSVHGQLFLTLQAINGGYDDILPVTLEINSNPLDETQNIPCAHVHFNDDSLAVSLFKVGDKILMRPETDVTIRTECHKIYGFEE